MERDKLTPASDVWRLFRDALSSETGWDAFEAAVLEPTGPREYPQIGEAVGPEARHPGGEAIGPPARVR